MGSLTLAKYEMYCTMCVKKNLCLYFMTGVGCVILSPTRELIMQTSSVLEQLAKPHGLKHTAFIGGIKIQHEREAWKSGV